MKIAVRERNNSRKTPALPSQPRGAALKALAARSESIQHSVQEIYLRRAFRFFQKAVGEIPVEVLEHALTAKEDEALVLEVVNRPETIDIAKKEDPFAAARARGRQAAKQLLEMEGGCGTIRDAMEALDMSKEGVEKRRRKGHLITIDTGKKGLLYPLWQFKVDKSEVLDGLEAVLAKLNAQGCLGWSVLSFFLNPHTDLENKTPLQALRKGKKEDVLFVAGNYGEMGR